MMPLRDLIVLSNNCNIMMILGVLIFRYQVFDFRMKTLEDHNDLAAVSKYHINAPWLANRTAASSIS